MGSSLGAVRAAPPSPSAFNARALVNPPLLTAENLPFTAPPMKRSAARYKPRRLFEHLTQSLGGCLWRGVSAAVTASRVWGLPMQRGRRKRVTGSTRREAGRQSRSAGHGSSGRLCLWLPAVQIFAAMLTVKQARLLYDSVSKNNPNSLLARMHDHCDNDHGVFYYTKIHKPARF